MPRGRPDLRATPSTPAHPRAAVLGLVGLLTAGALVRLGLFAAWRPAFMGWPDAKSYVDVAHGDLFSSGLRPAGYPLFLRLLHAADLEITGIVVVNHALGLGAAVLLYLAVVRAGGPPLLGLIPAALVALNGDAAFLEHSPLSEPLFIFLCALALYAATRSLDVASPAWPALAGAVVAASATVRVMGIVLVPVLCLWLAVAAGGGWRRRLAGAAVALAGAGAVLGAYAVAAEQATGQPSLSRNGAWHLYGRVAPFADCSRFAPAPAAAPLCETSVRADRPNVDAYIFNWWYSPAIRTYDYVFASTPEVNAVVGGFAWEVVRHQPLDYLFEVSMDSLRYVAPESLRGFGGGPSYADLVGRPILFNPTFQGEGLSSLRRFYGWRAPGFAIDRPWLDALKAYESATRVQGPLMVLLLLLAAAGPLVCRGRARRAAFLFAAAAFALLLAPVAALEFSARTAVPGFGALGAAAAVGGWGCLERVRARRPRRRLSAFARA